MPCYDPQTIPPMELIPGCRMRTPYGEHLMLSYLEMDEGAIVPLHEHPHEQGGIVIEGQIELTIDGKVTILETGHLYLIPPNTPHRAVAYGGPARVLDVFSPVREDYAEQMNKYIPETDSD